MGGRATQRAHFNGLSAHLARCILKERINAKRQRDFTAPRDMRRVPPLKCQHCVASRRRCDLPRAWLPQPHLARRFLAFIVSIGGCHSQIIPAIPARCPAPCPVVCGIHLATTSSIWPRCPTLQTHTEQMTVETSMRAGGTPAEAATQINKTRLPNGIEAVALSTVHSFLRGTTHWRGVLERRCRRQALAQMDIASLDTARRDGGRRGGAGRRAPGGLVGCLSVWLAGWLA